MPSSSRKQPPPGYQQMIPWQPGGWGWPGHPSGWPAPNRPSASYGSDFVKFPGFSKPKAPILLAKMSSMWSTPFIDAPLFLHHFHFQGPPDGDDEEDEKDDDIKSDSSSSSRRKRKAKKASRKEKDKKQRKKDTAFHFVKMLKQHPSTLTMCYTSSHIYALPHSCQKNIQDKGEDDSDAASEELDRMKITKQNLALQIIGKFVIATGRYMAAT